MNHATHEYKEEIKVGYNLQRKVVLMAIWAAVPIIMWLNPTFFGWFEPSVSNEQFINHVGIVWLVLGIGGVAIPYLSSFYHQGCANRIGLADQNFDRSVS